MRISDKTYDTIKFIAINLIPALVTLILALGDIWGLPYYVPISGTISAIGVFLAAIIGISKATYLADKQKETENVTD